MPVDITTVTPTYISFIFPGKKEEFTIERKEVQQIIYKSGKIDVLNKAAFELIDDSSWEAVWMTEDKKEVGDLYMLGEIEARSPSSARSASAAKKGAIIKLKKKAANMKGSLILVTKKETTGGYGEYPGIFYQGNCIRYGTPGGNYTARNKRHNRKRCRNVISCTISEKRTYKFLNDVVPADGRIVPGFDHHSDLLPLMRAIPSINSLTCADLPGKSV